MIWPLIQPACTRLTRLLVAALSVTTVVTAETAAAENLNAMVGCWVSDSFNPTSLLSDASKLNSAVIVSEKMLLRFHKIDGTDHLALGYFFEWDKAETYVLGPTYQNGAFNPAAGFLTFGFPEGGLDHVTMPAADKLLYVHTKSSNKSAMSVRRLSRLDCADADKLESDLLARQKELLQ